jgi:hypothetical protein
VNEVLAGSVLAANDMSAGTAGLLTIVLLFMSGSLKRMRGHVEDGDFAAANARRLAAKAGEVKPAEVKPAEARPAETATIPAQSTGAPPDA